MTTRKRKVSSNYSYLNNLVKMQACHNSINQPAHKGLSLVWLLTLRRLKEYIQERLHLLAAEGLQLGWLSLIRRAFLPHWTAPDQDKEKQAEVYIHLPPNQYWTIWNHFSPDLQPLLSQSSQLVLRLYIKTKNGQGMLWMCGSEHSQGWAPSCGVVTLPWGHTGWCGDNGLRVGGLHVFLLKTGKGITLERA